MKGVHIKLGRLFLCLMIVFTNHFQFFRINTVRNCSVFHIFYALFKVKPAHLAELFFLYLEFFCFSVHPQQVYIADLIEAEAAHWNLLTEKYARMMESTAPERYAELADMLPKRSKERIQMQEEMIARQIRWEEDFAAKFPGVASTGRVIHTSEDTPWDTSIETYARGEISTYSDRTVGLLKKLYDQMAIDQENLSEKTLRNMTALYGYESLEEAEKQQRARLER